MDIRPNRTHKPSDMDQQAQNVRHIRAALHQPAQPQKPAAPRTLKELIDSIQLTDRHTKQYYRQVGVRRFVAVFSLGLVGLVGILVVGIVVASGSQKHTKNDQTTVVASATDTQVSESAVSEDMLTNHSVAGSAPKFVSIPSIGLSTTRIFKVSSDQQGSIEQPENIADVGWYGSSTTPANDQGNVLLLGNISGVFSEGAFYSLYRISIGDEIEVLTGDNSLYRYKVTGKRELTNQESNIDEFVTAKEASKATLTLLTYSGEFNPATNTYENRLLVFALRD